MEGSRDEIIKEIINDYKNNGIDQLDDQEILKRILMISISTCDCEKLSKTLIEKYGNLDNVLNASVLDLLSFKEIDEATAVYLSLFRTIQRRIYANRNKANAKLDTVDAQITYIRNLISISDVERMLLINLDENMRVIDSHILGKGNSHSCNIDPILLTQYLLKDEPANCILAHNHPNSEATPSMSDYDFSINIMKIINSLGANLVDHIVVGRNSNYSILTNKAI